MAVVTNLWVAPAGVGWGSSVPRSPRIYGTSKQLCSPIQHLV